MATPSETQVDYYFKMFSLPYCLDYFHLMLLTEFLDRYISLFSV